MAIWLSEVRLEGGGLTANDVITYDNERQYYTGNVCMYDGGFWIAIQDTIGHTPVAGSLYWSSYPDSAIVTDHENILLANCLLANAILFD